MKNVHRKVVFISLSQTIQKDPFCEIETKSTSFLVAFDCFWEPI